MVWDCVIVGLLLALMGYFGYITYSLKLMLFLAYFPKIKVSLSNHQSVCLCVCVCFPPLITSKPLGKFSYFVRGNAIQVDLDALIFNPISSTILKIQSC
jgi:hypothetical protein